MTPQKYDHRCWIRGKDDCDGKCDSTPPATCSCGWQCQDCRCTSCNQAGAEHPRHPQPQQEYPSSEPAWVKISDGSDRDYRLISMYELKKLEYAINESEPGHLKEMRDSGNETIDKVRSRTAPAPIEESMRIASKRVISQLTTVSMPQEYEGLASYSYRNGINDAINIIRRSFDIADKSINTQPSGTTCENCQRFRKESCPYPGSNITMTMCNAFMIDLVQHAATIRNEEREKMIILFNEIESGIKAYEKENEHQLVRDECRGVYIPTNTIRRLIAPRKGSLRHTEAQR